MKKEFLPYYISRAALSIIFALLAFGFTWGAGAFALLLFGLFLLYLHSGWFAVDASHPLTPLRRYERARGVQRKALITAVMAGLLLYFTLPYLAAPLGLQLPLQSLALPLAVLTYFVVQFALLARA